MSFRNLNLRKLRKRLSKTIDLKSIHQIILKKAYKIKQKSMDTSMKKGRAGRKNKRGWEGWEAARRICDILIERTGKKKRTGRQEKKWVAMRGEKRYTHKCKQNMNRLCTFNSKMGKQNCEIVPKIEKVYKKYKKSIAILSKLLYIE